jgi:peptide/nickel transport system substrate-binding protein
MDEQGLRGLITEVKVGKASRLAFVQRMIALGLTAPMASQMLSQCSVAQAQTKFVYKPTKRGGGGALKLLWRQSPTLLNPHFAIGTKDQEGSRIFYEPLAAWDADGDLVAVLAAEIPSRENGGLAADGLSVTWKIKRDVKWHDGKPFTADDLVFNWEYASDPNTASVTIGSYKDVKVQKVDDYTVIVRFTRPTPFWADAFIGTRGMLIPKHLFADYKGANSREAPANLKPVGTGRGSRRVARDASRSRKAVRSSTSSSTAPTPGLSSMASVPASSLNTHFCPTRPSDRRWGCSSTARPWKITSTVVRASPPPTSSTTPSASVPRP